MRGLTVSDAARLTGGILTGDGGAEICSVTTDSREVRPGALFAAIKGSQSDGHDFAQKALDSGAACCLCERPVDVHGTVILVPDTVKALGALAAGYRRTLSIPLVGVTGSVGKTTAKEMTAAVLSQRFKTLKTDKNYNNQLGVPLTLCRIEPEHQAAVVELGISHFGEMRELAEMAMPTVALYTVIGRAHLEFLKNRDGVMLEKGRLLEVMPPEAVAVVNGDDDKLAALCCRQRKITYGTGAGCDIRALEVSSDGEFTSCRISGRGREFPVRIPAYGRHMVYAALGAAAVGMELGLTDGEIAAGIASYETVGRRARVIRTSCLTVVDDCYNANPDSAISAIRSLGTLTGRPVCILGDMLELGEQEAELHRETGEAAIKAGAELFTVGELSKHMGGRHFDSREQLIDALPGLLRKGDAVLVKASHSMGFDRISDALTRLEL